MIIICGMGKIQNDFQYIFPDIEVEKYILTENSVIPKDIAKECIVTFDTIPEGRNEIIICDREKEKCALKLNELGLKYGQDYKYADDYFGRLDYDIDLCAQGRKIVVWGTGESMELLLDCMTEEQQQRIECFVDNNLNKQGNKVKGKCVCAYHEINLLDKFVIVASDSYRSIRIQLLDLGLEENVDFIDSLKIWSRPSNMLKKTIYARCLKDNKCLWPFEQVNIQVNGIFICGWPSWLTTRVGSEYSYSLDEAWNSNVARVIRLSMLNHTYSFCCKETCAYLELEEEYVDDYIFDRNVGYAKETPKYPKFLECSFDETCNLRCPSCRKEGCYHNSVELDRTFNEVVDKIIDSQWIENSDIFVVPGNGELFFSKHYKRLVMENKGKGNNFIARTNGTLITEEYVNEIVKKYNYVEFWISIDAATPETFSKLRTGNWNALIKGLEIVSRYRKKGLVNRVQLSFTVQRDNYFEMLEFIELAKKYEFDWIYFTRIQNFSGWNEEEYWSKSMINQDGTMKEELIEVFKNPIIEDDIVDVRQFYRNLEISGYGDLLKRKKETVFFDII